MKHTIIICEGITDRDLISIYLQQVNGYTLTKNTQKFGLDRDQKLLTINKEDNFIYIIPSIGKTKIKTVFEKICDKTKNERNEDNLISKLYVFIDSDEDSQENLISLVDDRITAINKWTDIKIKSDAFNLITIKTILLAIPPYEKGAIERFVLSSFIDNGGEEKRIVNKIEECVETLKDVKYLRKNKENVDNPSNKRFRDKAKVGCLLSILSPDWSTGEMVEKLKQIEWYKLDNFNRLYEKLSET